MEDLQDIPTTGPEALEHALNSLDLKALEQEHRDVIASGKKTARPRSVKVLNVLAGIKNTGGSTSDFFIRKVPVIPPGFRPFNLAGGTFIPGDANELYKDVLEFKRLYRETEDTLGREGAGDAFADLYRSVKAAYGFSDSPNPKTQQRNVKGFFKHITGTSPKLGMFQRKMLSKTQDGVGRGVIIPDADLNMNEIGIPREMGWKVYAPYVQRRLVQGGMSPAQALHAVKNRDTYAQQAMDKELEERPVVYSRAPAWHRFNIIGGKPHLVDGDAIRINTWVTDGIAGDFDGDTMSVHVPSLPDTVQEVKDKLMPDKMLFHIKDKDKTVHNPKHEQVLGLYNAANNPSKNTHVFETAREAEQAIDQGKISLSDEITVLRD